MEDNQLDELRTLIRDLADYVDSLEVIPRRSTVADIVLLGLMSKAFSLFWAVSELAQSGFSEEAFGLARTSVELRFVARYLTNNDTDARCGRYYNFGAKALVRSRALLNTYAHDGAPLKLEPEIERLASEFNNHHGWADAKIRDFADEPNSFEFDSNGDPTTQTATYETLYWQMSSFVHVNIGALVEVHLPEAGDAFRLIRERTKLRVGKSAVEHSARSLGLVIARVLRFMGLEVSDELAGRFQRLLLSKKKSAG